MREVESAGHANSLVLYGTGGHAKSVINTLVDMPEWTLAGLISGQASECPVPVLGFPVLGDDRVLPGLIAAGLRLMHICIEDNQQRAAVAQGVRESGFELATIIHPSAMCSPGSVVGRGTLIQAGSLLGAETQAGEGCLLRSFVSIGHGTRMGHFVQFAGGSITGGDCQIGSYTCVGVGATILPRLRVGQHVLIEPNTVVLADVPDFAVVAGNPGRVVSMRV